MPDSAGLGRLIGDLDSPDPEMRKSAAAELYRLGSERSDPIVRAWRADAELNGLLKGPPTVGIAVLPTRFEKIRKAFGGPPLADVPADQAAREFELHIDTVGGAVGLDILTTSDPPRGGAIARFLEKNGEGIQQVEYPVRDVGRPTTLLRDRFGLQPVYPEPRAGANGTRVNFFLIRTPRGQSVLIELVEERK